MDQWLLTDLLTLSLPVLVVIVTVCILLQGFFSGSEIAFVSCDKVRLAQRAAAGGRGARLAQSLLSDPASFFSTTLLGVNLSTITGSTIMTLYLTQQYGTEYAPLAIILAPVVLVAAEVLPKSIYQHHADRVVDHIAPWLILVRTMLYPLVRALSWVTKRVLGHAAHTSREPRITRDELAVLLQGDEVQQSDIRPHERTMVARVLQLSRLRTKNVMKPLIEIEALPMTATPDAAFGIFELKSVDRIPIFLHRIYNVVGLLEASDLLCAPTKPIRDLIHPPLYVPEEMPLPELIRRLHDLHAEAAIVVDEYGGAVGIVTMEEILEEVVGDIWDEFTHPEQTIQALGKQHFMVQARVEVDDAQRVVGFERANGDFETIGGMLLHVYGDIPKVGTIIAIGAWRYRIHQATDRSIISVEVFPAG